MSARNRKIFTDAEIRFLGELLRARVEFMVVGLSAAALQGAPVVTQDVDLWFRNLADPGIKKALKAVRGNYVPPTGSMPPAFAGDGVDLFDIVVHMHGLGAFEEEMNHTLKMPLGRLRIPVLRLERILESKRALGRPKDQLYLRVLADSLKALGRKKGLSTKPVRKPRPRKIR